MLLKPFHYQFLRFFRKISLYHPVSPDAELTNFFSIKRMYVARFMLFRLEEQSYNNPIKACNLRYSNYLLNVNSLQEVCLTLLRLKIWKSSAEKSGLLVSGTLVEPQI